MTSYKEGRKTLGDFLHKLRVGQNKTLREFCKENCLDCVAVSHVENNMYKLDYEIKDANSNRDFDSYFLRIANLVGEMSTCNRGKVGCVLVRDKRILSTGYAGAPSGMPHCDTVGHEMENNHCVRTVHAEQNAIIQAAKHGVSIGDSTAYVTMVPCYTCAKMLVNAGVKRVVVGNEYRGSEKTKELLDSARIELKIVNQETLY